jgi:hypothetical protein
MCLIVLGVLGLIYTQFISTIEDTHVTTDSTNPVISKTTIPDGALIYYSIVDENPTSFIYMSYESRLNYAELMCVDDNGLLYITDITMTNKYPSYDWWKVGNYDFDIWYFNLLLDKDSIAEIVNRLFPNMVLMPTEIEEVSILEYSNNSLDYYDEDIAGIYPTAIFWVHTSDSDYFLEDDYEYPYDENGNYDLDNIIHNWKAVRIR